jgi:hypothetical protein
MSEMERRVEALLSLDLRLEDIAAASVLPELGTVEEVALVRLAAQRLQYSTVKSIRKVIGKPSPETSVLKLLNL